MVVGGGRSWRAVTFAPGLGCIVATFVIAMIGCGGRTSMLDLEGYGLGGASSGGSFTTGGTATGTAGTLLLPSAGQPSTPTTNQCAQYCSGYAKTCAKELNGRDCQPVCQAEIDGFGAQCRALGLAAIQCLTPFFQLGGGNCDTATSRALARCGNELAGFKACSASKPSPPIPTPDPADRSTCPATGIVSQDSCAVTFACTRDTYRTKCSLPGDRTRAQCFCYGDNSGWMGDIATTDFSLACSLAASECPEPARPGP